MIKAKIFFIVGLGVFLFGISCKKKDLPEERVVEKEQIITKESSAQTNKTNSQIPLHETDSNRTIPKSKEQLCEQGDPSICHDLAHDYYKGNGVTKDFNKAFYFAKKSCEGGDAKGCHGVGLMLTKGEGVAKNIIQGLSFFEKSCEKGFGNACFNVGLYYDNGDGVDKDVLKAIKFYEKACGLNDADGCSYVAFLYKEVKNIEKMKQAEDYYKKSCELKSGYGCRNLGNIYNDGKLVQKNDLLAAFFYQKACRLKDHDGCAKLGTLFSRGEGVLRNHKRAMSLFAESCLMDDDFSCYAMGFYYKQGILVKKDLDKASSLFKLSCEKGVNFACKELKSLPNSIISPPLSKELLTKELTPFIKSETEVPLSIWRVSRSQSKMDDSPSIYLFSHSHSKVKGWLKETEPTLVISCNERNLEVYVETDMSSSVESGFSGRHHVRTRFDDEPPIREVWSDSNDHKALFSSNPIHFLKQALQSSRFRFEFTPFQGDTQVVDFDLSGLDEHLIELVKLCPKIK